MSDREVLEIDEPTRYEAFMDLRKYHFGEIPKRFNIPVPRGSFDRWILENYLLFPDRPDPLLPSGKQKTSEVMRREILDDLPVKINRFPKSIGEAYDVFDNLLSVSKEWLGEDLGGIEVDFPRTNSIRDVVSKTALLKERIRPQIEEMMGDDIDNYVQDLSSRASMKPKNVPRTYLSLKTNRLIVGDKVLYLTPYMLETLRSRYKGRMFAKDVHNLILRYIAFIGEEIPNMHASIPVNTFKILRDKFGVSMELFASPFNATLGRYLSIFPDTDSVFCSAGNFFDVNLSPGSYEANPPFVEELMDAFIDKVHEYLRKYNDPTSFVIFMPAWDDSESIQVAKSSPFLKALVRLDPQKHVYVRKSATGKKKMITAPNASYVAFLQNEEGYKEWKPDSINLKQLKESMLS